MTIKPDPQAYEQLSKEELLARLRGLQSDPRLQGPLPESQRLVHELQVHQVELEMQNEQLRMAQEDLEHERERYVALYDFAPVGYLSVTREGLIAQANLTAVRMLGVERTRLMPYLPDKPFVTPTMPPSCSSPTSSPRTMTLGSRSIAWSSARLMA